MRGEIAQRPLAAVHHRGGEVAVEARAEPDEFGAEMAEERRRFHDR
nr:hypothetical protein [Streptomyces xiaopingdaonensis]